MLSHALSRIARFTVILCGCMISGGSISMAAELGANKTDLEAQYVWPSTQYNAVATGPERAIRLAMGKKSIADARDAGLRFLRVSVTGYWPVNFGDGLNDLALWQSNPDQFWAMEDEMFNDLDKAGLQIVPVFVWNPAQFPVLGGDTVTTFVKDPNSHSRQLLDRFIQQFVARYSHRRTILFYELTNEMNLEADVDLSDKCPKGGSPRCVWENFSTADMMKFSGEYVSLLKKLDPTRKISSGYSLPRPAAMHLLRQPGFSSAGPDWTADSPQEFSQYVVMVNAPFDIVSVHIYPGAERDRFGRGPSQEFKLVSDAASAAKLAGKPLFIGEFGDNGATPFMKNMLDEIVRNHVDYAAIWTWEFYQTSTFRTHDTDASRTSLEPGYSDELISLLEKTEAELGTAAPLSNKGQPRIVLTWPLPCAAVDKPTDIDAVASDGAKGVEKVEFLIDGKLLGSSTAPPYRTHFDPAGFGNKVATLQGKAYSRTGVYTVFNTQIRLNGAQEACR